METAESRPRRRWNIELIVVIMLGIASVAANADTKIAALTMTGVDEVLEAALVWSNTTGEYPLNSDDYLETRFGEYRALQEQAADLLTTGDAANANGDKLTLYTVLLAVALFLLGIAAVVSSITIKRGLIVIGGVVTVVAIVFTTLVPFTPVG